MTSTANTNALELALMLKQGDAQDSDSQRDIAAHIERLVQENEQLRARLPRSGVVVIDAGALNIAINALRRDAEEGRAVRGEMADLLVESAKPLPEPTNIRVWGYVWRDVLADDGCHYVPCYTPAQHIDTQELLALVDPSQLSNPLSNTKWHTPAVEQ